MLGRRGGLIKNWPKSYDVHRGVSERVPSGFGPFEPVPRAGATWGASMARSSSWLVWVCAIYHKEQSCK